MKASDAEILTMMKSPHKRELGLRKLMDTYQSRLYWHIRRMVVEHEGTQDILQNTFIKIYQKIDAFKEESTLFTWLYKIASNEALQYLDKEKKMPRIGMESAKDYMESQINLHADPNAEEIQILLQKAIHTLPEKQRLVFNLRYYDEIPYEEISQIVEMSVGTLKTNYHYAKQKIEIYIKEHYEKI